MNRIDRDCRVGVGLSNVKIVYGQNAITTQVGKIRIVHLDNPTEQMIKKRIEEVIAEEISGDAFEACCPLCRQIKNEPYDVVYDGF